MRISKRERKQSAYHRRQIRRLPAFSAAEVMTMPGSMRCMKQSFPFRRRAIPAARPVAPRAKTRQEIALPCSAVSCLRRTERKSQIHHRAAYNCHLLPAPIPPPPPPLGIIVFANKQTNPRLHVSPPAAAATTPRRPHIAPLFPCDPLVLDRPEFRPCSIDCSVCTFDQFELHTGVGMGAEHQLLSPTPSSAAAAEAGRAAWAPHGRLLTGCLVALNVFLVLLVYFYFWRFVTRRRDGDEEGGAGDDAAASSSPEASPPASPKARDRREVERAITALPVFVHSGSDSDGSSAAAAAECAICIAEFADGEQGRLLPRCGHRFHARCVDTWFRFHTTCPLCRASVLLDAPIAAAAANRQSSDTVDTDCPV